MIVELKDANATPRTSFPFSRRIVRRGSSAVRPHRAKVRDFVPSQVENLIPQDADLAADFVLAARGSEDDEEPTGVSPAIIEQALQFVALLPASLPKPGVTAASGTLWLEWYRRPRWRVVVRVGAGSIVVHAALLENAKAHGSEPFDGKTPPTRALAELERWNKGE